MKRIVSLLLILSLLCLSLPALAAGAKIAADFMPFEVREFFSKSAFDGYTIGEAASCLVENTVGGTYFFAVAQKSGYNVLYGFRESAGHYEYWLRTDAALPQGTGDFELAYQSGYLNLVSAGEMNIGEGFSIVFYRTGDDQADTALFFSVTQGGQFQLKVHCFHYVWDEAIVSPSSITYYLDEGSTIRTVYGVVETNLRYFSLSAFPKSLKEAREALSNPPAIPGGDLNAVNIHFAGGEKFEVYTGPGTMYERAANGKASVSTNDWIQVFGSENGYILIQYDISSSQNRFGYIPLSAVPSTSRDKVKPLQWALADAEITSATFLTDDPLGSQARLRNLAQGQSGVKWLGTMGAWVYVEVTGLGASIRGFVPASVIRRPSPTDLTAFYENALYRAKASVSLNADGGAAVQVDVWGPSAWTNDGADSILRYQLFANNVPAGATTETLPMPGKTASDWWYTFLLSAPLPAGTTLLGLCPQYRQSGLKAEEMILLPLSGASSPLPAASSAGSNGGYQTAYVHNPDAKDRLHLRKSAYGSAASLGKYYNGTEVILLPDTQAGAEWAHVRIGDTTGYMQAEFLSSVAVPSAQPTVTISNTGGTGLNLRAGQDTDSDVIRLLQNGTAVTVLGLTEDWLHVQSGADTGYIRATGVSPRLSYTYVSSVIQGRARITADCSGYKKPIQPGDWVGDAGDPDGLIVNTYYAGSIVTVYQVQGGYAQVNS